MYLVLHHGFKLRHFQLVKEVIKGHSSFSRVGIQIGACNSCSVKNPSLNALTIDSSRNQMQKLDILIYSCMECILLHRLTQINVTLSLQMCQYAKKINQRTYLLCNKSWLCSSCRVGSLCLESAPLLAF